MTLSNQFNKPASEAPEKPVAGAPGDRRQVCSRWVVWTFRVLIAAIVAGTVLYYTAFHYYPSAGAVILTSLGLGPNCRLTQVGKACHSHLQQVSIGLQLERSSKILERTPDGLLAIQTSKGRFWVPNGMNLPSLLAEQQVKYASVSGFQVRQGDIVLDCGANVGVFTRAALDAGAKIVVAIEPSPRNVLCLRWNFAREIAEGRVLLYPKGVWDRDDFLTLNESSTAAEDSFVLKRNEVWGGVKVALTTIDKLRAELHLQRVDFIKMDIEGAERRALAGARETIAKFKPRMEISVNHLPDDPQTIPAVIRRARADYGQECLECAPNPSGWRVDSEILYFH